MSMLREPNSMLITIATSVDDSTEIDTARFATGSFQLPAGSGTTGITVYVQVGSVAYAIANDMDWIPLPAKEVVAGLPYPLPPIAHSFPRMKLVASAGDATENVPVFIKS
ncbi:MAG: hypothetical protein ACYC4U_11345 [Pirellulaceae bacterium]